MKKLISLFLVALICISFLFVVPTSAVNGVGLWYDKLGNNVKITVKGIESASAILLVGKYQNKKMVSSENYPITNHNGSYTSQNVAMDDGFEYRFFVWESLTNAKPLFDCLSLSTETADGVGSTEDNSVKSVTIRENLRTGWYSSGVYSYYPDLEARVPTRYELVTSGITVFYNNTVITDRDIEVWFDSLEELLLEADVITLIGYGTAPYSEIHITDYTYKVVDWVDVEEKVIGLYYGYLALDGAMRGNVNFTYNLYDEVGNAIELSDLKEYDVLNILVPCNKDIDTADHLDIYVSRKVIEGKVEELLTTSNEYIISGEKYLTETKLLLGDEGKFFLTIDGKIAWKYINIDIGKLGLITEIKSETEEASTRYTLTLFTQEGFIDLPVAESLEFIDDSNCEYTYTTADNGQDALFGTDSIFANALADAETENEARENINKKFIAYRLNSSGEIDSIRMGNKYHEEPFYSDRVKDVYDSEKGKFGSWDTENSVLIFALLVERISGWNIDMSKLSVADFSNLKDKSTYTLYNGNCFVKEAGTQEELCAVILTKEEIYEPISEYMSVVESIGSKLDADENVVRCVTFIQNGEYKTLSETYNEKAVEKSGLETGDIFFYETKANDEIVEVKLIYDASSRRLSDYAKSMSIYNDNEAFLFGVVGEFSDAIKITSEVNETDGMPVTFERFRLDYGFDYNFVMPAEYNEEQPGFNSVKVISANNIRETVRPYSVYAVVARVNQKERICDLVQIVLSSNDFNEWADINNFNNWKLTY